ncbi:SPOR domain-containing protein [Roseibium algae]|uniref:SPOR domain-containing protein n=1 Tax=Roseibium algae TaxID=3123038 RepID=A0ABU8TQ03_9HYPH
MAKDDNYPTSDAPPVEDPLVELARIVNRNRQPGDDVSSDRVGSTDYFAGLEDISHEASTGVSAAKAPQVRIEPVVSSDHASTVAPVSYPVSQGSEPHFAEQPVAVSEETSVQTGDFAPQDLHIDDLQSEIPTTAFPETDPQVNSEDALLDLGLEIPESKLEHGLSLDLETSLTAELEDELIGAFRQTFDAAPAAVPEIAAIEAVGAAVDEAPYRAESHEALPQEVLGYQYTENAEPAFQDSRAESSGYENSGYEPLGQTGYEQAKDDSLSVAPQGYVEEAPVETYAPREDYRSTLQTADYAVDTGASSREAQGYERDHAVSTRSETAPEPSPEDDLFAELGSMATVDPINSAAAGSSANQFDTLFAELDTKPGVQSVAETANDIDDMAWPAAASAVPVVSDDELPPPPPEGYDLDAVAKAMHEGDPTLGNAGVLPPHTRAEKAAAPHAPASSRKGLYAAAAVLAVAVLGGVAFLFSDGSSIRIPDGPPPVIAGLAGPLKIYPDAEPKQDDQSSKLIYDRVGNVQDNSRERLVLPEKTQPAQLPPAPEGVVSSDPLVPGAPKKVRTLVVRPDGTIVDDQQPSAPLPNTPRTVSTTPVTATPAPPVQVEAPATTPSLSTPAIVSAATTAVGTVDQTSPAGIVPSVLPRKKPAVPTRTARVTQSGTSSGPLDLNNSASQIAPAAVQQAAPAVVSTAGGSIAAGTYVVQVTSQRSESAARETYSTLQRKFPSVLGNRNAVIVSAVLPDRGTFYRARIPMGSRADALNLCESLQGAGGDCFVRRN